MRYADEQEKANRRLDLTSLTVEEFEQLAPVFEAAFVRQRKRTGIAVSSRPWET